jgi:hypothetical protein
MKEVDPFGHWLRIVGSTVAVNSLMGHLGSRLGWVWESLAGVGARQYG